MTIEKSRPEEIFPPVFWTPLTDSDAEILERQNNGRRFDVGMVYAVAARCSRGCPQVVVCFPSTSDGTPFPTLFWLTCPYLDKKCGELESRRMIPEIEKIFADEKESVAELHREYSAMRACVFEEFLKIKKARPARAIADECGVGGINWLANPSAAKCLHLQTATWLGLGSHPASEWLAEKLEEIECADGPCRKDGSPA